MPFEIDVEHLKKYPVQDVGGRIHNEHWIPSEEPEEFNKHIVGTIKVIREFYSETT